MEAIHGRSHYRRLIAPALSVALLLGMLAIFGCSLSGVALPPSQREEAFQKTLAIPIDPQLHLLTEKNRYSREDWIGIRAENKTRYVLRFKDQSLGLQAYQYGEQGEAWRLIDLGSVQGDPHLTIVTPGPRSLLPSDSIPADGIKASGTIRLVIVGTTEQGQQVAAYKDVEIMD